MARLKASLGSLYTLDPLNPTGHYRLDLSLANDGAPPLPPPPLLPAVPLPIECAHCMVGMLMILRFGVSSRDD
eukprot:COSAG05_NODE_3912_length_1776_cov_155.137150_4_plen_73_part_00